MLLDEQSLIQRGECMIKVTKRGDFKRMHRWLNKLSNGKHYENILNKYGRIGLEALRKATPVDTGKTADSWKYEIEAIPERGYYRIIWSNTNVVNGWANIAILLQYGHATGTGGYVEGRDYINPALQPVFDEIKEKLWEEIEVE